MDDIIATDNGDCTTTPATDCALGLKCCYNSGVGTCTSMASCSDGALCTSQSDCTGGLCCGAGAACILSLLLLIFVFSPDMMMMKILIWLHSHNI
jgi:hypothetical protein